MSLFRNIVLAAVIAGLLSGLILTVIQNFSTIPLILQAETYEGAAPEAGHSHSHDPNAPAGAAHSHDHDEEAWAPADGIERFVYTAGANILAAIGFGLLLIVVAEALGGFGGWRRGLMFGIGGFIAVSLAPGLGLPPELPGMPAAELGPRQIWWVATAVSTAAGLGLLAFGRNALLAAAAILLLIAPHLIGAPLPESHETAVPHELHARFVSAVFASNLVFWAILGASVAVLRARFNAGEEQSPAVFGLGAR